MRIHVKNLTNLDKSILQGRPNPRDYQQIFLFFLLSSHLLATLHLIANTCCPKQWFYMTLLFLIQRQHIYPNKPHLCYHHLQHIITHCCARSTHINKITITVIKSTDIRILLHKTSYIITMTLITQTNCSLLQTQPQTALQCKHSNPITGRRSAECRSPCARSG